jgi:hypothetical protein
MQAREAALKSSKWDKKMLEFITDNATNWELDTFPGDLAQWISHDKNWEEAQKSGRWLDFKLLMPTQEA